MVEIIEGTTTPQKFQLLEAGGPLDLSGITVTLRLRDKTGSLLTTTNMVSVSNAVNGEVLLTPTASGLFVASASPYYARWVLTLSNGQISYCPSDLEDLWTILAK